MTDRNHEENIKQLLVDLQVFAPFSSEPKDEDIEHLKNCTEMMKEAGDNLFHATSVLTEAIIIATRCVLDREGRRTVFRLGSECRLAENEFSTEASIAWQIARMLLRSGLVKMEKPNVAD